MANSYMTSSTLIASIQRRISIPLNQLTFQAADLLAFADEEIKIGLVPSIMSMHEEYYVYSQSIPLVGGVSNYAIPYRALGGKLRDIFYKDINGNLREMTRVSPDDKAFHQLSSTTNYYYKFYLEGNDVVLLPSVGTVATGFIVMSYYLRPNNLVDESRAAYIQAITPNSVNPSTQTDIMLSTLPANLSANSLVDLMQTLPGHRTRAFDVPILASIAGTNVITISSPLLPSTLTVGDYIASSGECIIIQAPTDLHAVVAQRVANRVLDAIGDQQGLASGNQKMAEMEMKTGNLIDNRVEGAPQKIVNLRGGLRVSRLNRRGGY